MILCFHCANPSFCSAIYYVETSELMWTANRVNGFFIKDNIAKWRINYIVYIHRYKDTYCLPEKVRFENLIWKKQKRPLRGVLENRSSETCKSSNNTYEEVHICRLITSNFTKNYFLHRYFSGIFTANFTWQTSEKLCLRTLFPEHLGWLLLKWLIQHDKYLWIFYSFFFRDRHAKDFRNRLHF